MNLWECQHHDCSVTATGVGGARGLRAIGWYFEPGPIIFCPAHHPAGYAAAQAIAASFQLEPEQTINAGIVWR